MNVKFGVFADLHIDIMHDGEASMTEFLEACRKEDVDFVVLDGNYGKVDGKFGSYENGNYFDFPKSIPYLSDTQLSWLEKDLEETKYPAVLFSHQRLTEGYASIKNAEDLRVILKKAPNGVPLAINGHEHRDTLDYVDGTYFLNLNSISCMWVGTKYADLGKYSAEIDEKFPDIRHVIPYDRPLYTIVTITDAGAEIKGCKAEFVGKTTDALGINEPDSGFVQKGIVITSDIQERFLSFEK